MTFQFVLHALSPLLDASLLTSYCPNSNLVTPGLITVACTGSKVPTEEIHSLVPRYVFYEASIADENSDGWSKELTPLASGNLMEVTGWSGDRQITQEETERIRDQVERAHRKGIKVRYDGLPK